MPEAIKPRRETLEMLDGRKFFSDDNLTTIWQARGDANGKSHRKMLDKEEADLIRFLVIQQGTELP